MRESLTDRSKYMKSNRFSHIFLKCMIIGRKKNEITFVKEHSPRRSKRASNNAITVWHTRARTGKINYTLYLGRWVHILVSYKIFHPNGLGLGIENKFLML